MVLWIAACESIEEKYGPKRLKIREPVSVTTSDPSERALTVKPIGRAAGSRDRAGDALVRPEFYYGSGRTIGPLVQTEPGPDGRPEMVTFNFVGTTILEAVDVLLGQTLGVNYVFDEKVQGTVTARTSNPIPRSAVLSILENILALNGAALIEANGVLNVVPVEAVANLPKVVVTPSKRPQRPGVGTHIIPLRYASVESVKDIATSQVSPGNQLAVDATRNILIYTGPSQEASVISDLVSVLDVDLLSGKSFGLFPVQSSRAEDVADELTMLFSDPSLGNIRASLSFLPIERLNAILAITARPGDLDKVAIWISRLDRSDSAAGQRVYVYYAKNSRAADLVDVLSQVFLGRQSRRAEQPRDRSPIAPGLQPVQTYSPPLQGESDGDAERTDTNSRQATISPVDSAFDAPPAIANDADDGRLRIVADERNNAVVVIATAEEFRLVEAALRQIDILPLQVLIEATIAEVTLNDDLEYGLQWAFESGDLSGGLISDAPTFLAPGAFSGFNLVLDTTEVRVVLRALAEMTNVEVISSPQLMVLDNQSARLQVGDQVPVLIGETITEGGTTVQSTQYFDTGVILEVTPRVNASGLVTLEISQEVSDAVDSELAGVDQPIIQQRRIRSLVSVQSGETIALGGLIRERATDGQSGIPVLMDIPVLGNAFKTTGRALLRTELLVLITPRVIRGPAQAREVTNELRKRLTILQDVVAVAE